MTKQYEKVGRVFPATVNTENFENTIGKQNFYTLSDDTNLVVNI